MSSRKQDNASDKDSMDVQASAMSCADVRQGTVCIRDTSVNTDADVAAWHGVETRQLNEIADKSAQSGIEAKGARQLKLRQSFRDFIFATNTDGSGKAASYVRALDMLGPILTKHNL